jgi:dihydroflavonol-4-reductase
MRAFVTGATGFLGLNLVELLVARGAGVTALVRAASDLRFLARFPVRQVVGDVLDPASLAAAMPEGCDVVFHTVGDMSFWRRAHARQEAVNVGGTEAVIAVARARGARRLVYTSSAAALGLHPGRIDEGTAPTGERSSVWYVRTKALAERAVLAAAAGGLEAVVLEPTTMIGRYETRLWPDIVRRIKRGALPGVAPGRTSWADGGAVAAAHLAAAERGRSGERYLLGGPDASFLEVVQAIARLVGGRAPRRAMPGPLLRALGRAMELAAEVTRRPPVLSPEGVEYLIHRNIVSSDKARRELGYAPPLIDTILRDYLAWLEAEQLL